MYLMKCLVCFRAAEGETEPLSPLEVVFTNPAHAGAVLSRSASSCCSSAVVAWSKVVKDLNPADLWILFIMSTDY